MLELTCHCGQVRVEVDKPPEYVNECNCSLCSKAGVRWAYFHPSDARAIGPTRSYRRADKDDPNAEIHFCGTCGSTVHFTLTESAVAKFGNTLMGVNMRLANETELTGIELRYPNGRDWPGEGDFDYIREPRVLG